MVFKTFLPTFISGFIIFGIADHVNMRLNLLQFASSTEPLMNASNDERDLEGANRVQESTNASASGDQ